ncbi:MAG: AtzE family amidohydrolase [Acetobacteraceae bacterium]|nr:AtzE family amidohydrolase [Acetobacteraceae bacterium]
MSWAPAAEIAQSVAKRESRACDRVEAALARIAEINPKLNAFSAVIADRARRRAKEMDSQGASGPLVGVPFAVKNLFDVAGLPTLAGSRINRAHGAAEHDAVLVARMEAAGAILLGTLTMGEYAYDFTGENSHYGPTRNPHDTARMAGGSSSGSAAAVAGGLVPLALSSDTNGSIRVPASFCGIFGLKPTYGRLSRTGTFPFVASLDHLGPHARTVADLALAYDAMQGPDPHDPVCANRAVEPTVPLLQRGGSGLRIAIAAGYFRSNAAPEAIGAVTSVARALGVNREVDLPAVAEARSAAFLITTSEGGSLHLGRLREQAEQFDPDVRDRLIAGALLPASLWVRAQKFRRCYRDAVARVFEDLDAIIALATPFPAPLIGQKTMLLDGVEQPLRPNIGIYTQPISFIGLPVVAAPVQTTGPLPIGVQVIAAPWREDVALRIAAQLEADGVAKAPRPNL